MGNTQNSFFVDQTDSTVSRSDSTLVTTLGSTTNNMATDLQEYGQNNDSQSVATTFNNANGHLNNHTHHESPIKRNYNDYRNGDAIKDNMYASPPRFEFQGSPIPFSDQSTDNESAISMLTKVF